MSSDIAIHWFRQDLRLSDNPALDAATQHESVLPIYILDDEASAQYRMGAASRVWLHHSLGELNKSLNGKLAIFRGDARVVLSELTSRVGVRHVYWNRCYEPWRVARDRRIKSELAERGIAVHSRNGSLLWEPWSVCKADGTPYKVFTPYYRNACVTAPTPRAPLAAPSLQGRTIQAPDKAGSLTLDELELLPNHAWARQTMETWRFGENAAHARLDSFLDSGIERYKAGRDFPASASVSRLSPHLHFGELSPQQAWYSASRCGASDEVEHFRRELAWREFSHSLLYHFPGLPQTNLQSKFDRFPWLEQTEHLQAWQRGQTGHPLVDAGMRELWQTGYMHNRVRMVVGSFLVKNLLLHWHHGAAWFWDCLFDADLANNSASWQWIAGCGADAAPYFRVFNPATQGEKFDPQGQYTRRFVPELDLLPDKYLYRPWEAPPLVLREAGVRLGQDYPLPIVDLKTSRGRALEAYATVRGATN